MTYEGLGLIKPQVSENTFTGADAVLKTRNITPYKNVSENNTSVGVSYGLGNLPYNPEFAKMGVDEATFKGLGQVEQQGVYDSAIGGGLNPVTNNYEGLKTGLAGVNAASNVMNAVTGWKSLGLAKDQFNFEKAAANRNLQNQGLAYNTALDKSAGIAATTGGLSQQQIDAYREAAKQNYMNTSAIG